MYPFSNVRNGHSLFAAAAPGSYRPWGPSSGNSCLAASCPPTWPFPESTLPGAATQLSPCLPWVGKCALEQWPWLTGCASPGPCSCYHSPNPLSAGDWEVNPRDVSKCCSSGFATPEVSAPLDLKSRVGRTTLLVLSSISGLLLASPPRAWVSHGESSTSPHRENHNSSLLEGAQLKVMDAIVPNLKLGMVCTPSPILNQ